MYKTKSYARTSSSNKEERLIDDDYINDMHYYTVVYACLYLYGPRRLNTIEVFIMGVAASHRVTTVDVVYTLNHVVNWLLVVISQEFVIIYTLRYA